MEFQGKTVHLSEVVTRRGGKTYRSFYLRHAYRENGRIKKETLLKLTPEEAEVVYKSVCKSGWAA